MNKFSSNMQKDELLALLKELKIDLKKNTSYKYDFLSFDAVVSGAYVNVLNTVNFKAFIKSRIHTFQPAMFKYSEICPALPLIFDKMQPSDFKVRVFGDVYEHNDFVIVNLQIDELTESLKRIWENKCVNNIQTVTAFSAFDAATQEFFNSFKFEKSDNVCFSVLVTSEYKPVQMENVTACRLVAQNQYLLNFDNYCTLKFSNDAIIAFKYMETERGVTAALNVVYYANEKYYKEQVTP